MPPPLRSLNPSERPKHETDLKDAHVQFLLLVSLKPFQIHTGLPKLGSGMFEQMFSLKSNRAATREKEPLHTKHRLTWVAVGHRFHKSVRRRS